MDVRFILVTDAVTVDWAPCSVSQVQCGKERVIAFAVRALTKAERNYSTTGKELLALVWGASYFETYL